MAAGFVFLAVFAALLWVLPMYLAGKSADDKGYGIWTGTLLGCFLGWIGVLIAALLPYKPGAGTGLRPKDTCPCPHCGEDIKVVARVCRWCGRDVEPLVR